ncbi:MAG: alginate export family protein [Bryobacterales bacterium]|nr:alginate export family protein [Bryobacterales bacterium]
MLAQMDFIFPVRSVALAICMFLPVCPWPKAGAQASSPRPAGAPTASTPAKPSPIEIHGGIRSRLEMWDWFGGTDLSSYAYSGSLVKLSFAQTGKHANWKVELAAPILLGLPEDAQISGAQGQLGLGASYYAANDRTRNAAMVFPKQAYLEFHHLGAGGGHGVKIGRFEFIDGTELTPKNATLAALKRTRVNQRILGTFGWSHVGRSFDGAHYSWNGKTSNVTVIGATPTRGVFQVDGWGWNRTAFAYGAYSHAFTGKTSASEVRVFSVFYNDFRDVLKTDNRPLAARQADTDHINIATVGGHFVHVAETPAGTLDVLAWGVGQTGSWGTLDHRAGAAVLEAGFQPKGIPALKPWLRAGYSRTTGDDNPADGAHNTFFQLMPTPRPYAKFPFYDMVNNEDRYAILTLRPHARLSVVSEIHALRLTSRGDLWYSGGGVFQPWTFGYAGRASGGARGLATLADIGAVITLHKQFSIEAYYGYANGKSVMRNIYPSGKNGSFGFLEANYTF